MAAKSFATKLQRNTNKIIAILAYAMLEWILISLLLLNSLFTYLIVKFANYFGLKSPCLWCSRVDHILEPRKRTLSYRDLVCDGHAREISNLGYCTKHGNLVELRDICEQCLASQSASSRKATRSPVSAAGIVENGECIARCSCCNVVLSREMYSTCSLLNHSSVSLDYSDRENLVIEARNPVCSSEENNQSSNTCRSQSERVHFPDFEGCIKNNSLDLEEATYGHQKHDHPCPRFKKAAEKSGTGDRNKHCYYSGDPPIAEICEDGTNKADLSSEDTMAGYYSGEDASLGLIKLNCQDNSGLDSARLIPTEVVDMPTTGHQSSKDIDMKMDYHCNRLITQENNAEKIIYHRQAGFSSDDAVEEDNYWVSFLQKKIEQSVCKAFHRGRETYFTQTAAADFEDAAMNQGSLRAGEVEQERLDYSPVKIISEINSSILSNQVANGSTDKKIVSSLPSVKENQLSSDRGTANISSVPRSFMTEYDLGMEHEGEAASDKQEFFIDQSKEGMNNMVSMQSAPGEVDDEEPPETPASIEYVNLLQKSLQLQKTESITKKSSNGSAASELECGHAILTNAQINATIKDEQKALKALFAELEEERSASAIAVSHTMAMITRLQEEKAQMQMEALHYERMMEEQSKYDQEALQLLNALMAKREKEKQELENELEIYRKKVSEYEDNEKTRTVSPARSEGSRNSSASCSKKEDSDNLSLNINNEVREEDYLDVHCNNSSNELLDLEEMALDCVNHMAEVNESLAEYEGERLSILDQLKSLEEKLIAMGANEGLFDDTTAFDCNPKDKDIVEETPGPDTRDRDGVHNSLEGADFSERNTTCSMAKSLLPLLDAAEDETVETTRGEFLKPEYTRTQNASARELSPESKKLAIEEMDRVYEKLHALKANWDFVGHSMDSMNEEDKGMNLLQDILQHLQELKAVELCVSSMNNS